MSEYIQYLAELIPEKDSLKLVKNEAHVGSISHWICSCLAKNIYCRYSEYVNIYGLQHLCSDIQCESE